MKNAKRRGMALITLYLGMALLTALIVTVFSRSISESRANVRFQQQGAAESLAEAGIDEVIRGVGQAFEQFFIANGRLTDNFSWFDDLPNAAKYVLPSDAAYGAGTYSVQITAVDTDVSGRRDVTLHSTAQVDGITKSLTAVVRYEVSQAGVFDYSYFINNFGWYWGHTITSNGDVRSNGNFSFMNDPVVNGDVYASVNTELGASGDIDGTNLNDSIADYRSTADPQARPTNPTADPQDIDGDGIDETFDFDEGYDGESNQFEYQDAQAMPYLGGLDEYKNRAVAENGSISQDGTVLVSQVLDNNLVLIGTPAKPIVLNGPVVVTGDVIIRGTVTGQGTVYAGRNVHIVGDITYANPPVWPKPDTNPEATTATNKTRDFLGLAARGSMLVGDYTSATWSTVKSYLQPPFTQAYAVDAADGDIGYVDYYSDGDPYFDGNYLDYDGGTKSDGSARRFYESSFSNATFSSYCSGSFVTKIDAVCYTNHVFTGRLSNAIINGTVSCRDEAIVYNGHLTLNHDIRPMQERQTGSFFLPQALETPRLLFLQYN